MVELTGQLAGRALDQALERDLARNHGVGSAFYEKLLAGCRDGIAAGWMCNREADGIPFGRVVKPSPQTRGFSVDVVDMSDCIGPHHLHPEGEIDLVMPIDGSPVFDGQSAGWKVYGPGSAHSPTVRGGRALVLYLLPNGAITFTGKREEEA